MKSVKLASLFALLSVGLIGCTAEVAPTEPTAPAHHASTDPGQGGAPVGNQPIIGTNSARTGTPISPWAEPLPNPWKPGSPDDVPGQGTTPSTGNPGAPEPPPMPAVHIHVVDDPDTERYHGPNGHDAW